MSSRESEILDKIASGYSLRALSPVAMRLVRLASDENISANDLSDVIEKDPSITVRLLRLANSVFFRLGYPITSIGQAIQLIGLNRLRVMALSLSLRDTFPIGRVGAFDYEEFWRMSLYQALLAKYLAQSLRTCKPDEAFVSGLILEIGLLIFYDLFVKKDATVDRIHLQPLRPLLKWEEERYGINHRQVGAAALKFWKFPQEMIDCQRFYDLEPKSNDVPKLALVCDMAREISGIICQKSMEWQPLLNKAEETYGLEGEVLSDIIVSAFEEVQDTAESFKLEMNKQQDLLAIMEKANRALSALSERMIHLNEARSKVVLPTFADLEAKNLSVREALQAVVHEIRNPLTAIGGFARKLEKTLNPASDEWQYVRVIVEESSRLESALDELSHRKQK